METTTGQGKDSYLRQIDFAKLTHLHLRSETHGPESSAVGYRGKTPLLGLPSGRNWGKNHRWRSSPSTLKDSPMRAIRTWLRSSRRKLTRLSAWAKRYASRVYLSLQTNASTARQIIAVWGMKCVGYDYKFEKHLARSLKGVKPTSSGLPRKRKAPARDSHAISEDEGGEESDSESEDTSPSKHHRAAKGKAKRVKYDWSGAKYRGDSQDEDYRPDSS